MWRETTGWLRRVDKRRRFRGARTPLLAGGSAALGIALTLWVHAAMADAPVQLCAKSTGEVLYAASGNCPANAPTALPPVAAQADLSALQSKLTTDEATIASLESKLSSLQTRLASVSLDGSTLTIAGAGANGSSGLRTVLFTGVNVQVENGSGSESTSNGLGNLIVGYNDNSQGLARTGSHNLVVGDDNGWSSHGGLVAGENNQITAPFASVSGGSRNTANAADASVSGGFHNAAIGASASVSGGSQNTASGASAAVSGGALNIASGSGSSILGGFNETIGSAIHCGFFPGSPTTSTCP